MIGLKIALRNIVKNSRRSVFTMVAIGVGFAAVNMFGGFQAYIFQGMRDALIYAQAQGHVSVFAKRVVTPENENEFGSTLITPLENKAIREEIAAYPELILATEHIQISGLLSNGDISMVFIATGRVPSHTDLIRSHAKGMIGKLKLFDGKPLLDNMPYGIGVSAGLAEKLHVRLDSDVIVMGPTVDGQINAMDAKILQLLESPAAELNDKFILVPMDFAKSLYNTQGVDRILILLQDTKDSEAVRDRLNRVFQEKGLGLEAKSWEEITPFYTKVKDLFNVIFCFLFVIVLVIVVMSVVNTMSMAVMERIREVGTIRAMGVKQRGVIRQFALESVLLSCLGSVLGVGMTFLGWLLVKIIEPTWVPPHITIRVPVEVYMVPEYMLITAFVLVILSMGAAIFPARKAARMNIVEALGHT
jgi:putative ABC transport system permease protein